MMPHADAWMPANASRAKGGEGARVEVGAGRVGGSGHDTVTSDDGETTELDYTSGLADTG